MTKAEYLRANFTFIIRSISTKSSNYRIPGLNPSVSCSNTDIVEPYLCDADEPIPWDVVEELVRLSARKRSESELLNPLIEIEEGKCPICLCRESTITAARVAKCGHIFCFPCVLRYLSFSAGANPYLGNNSFKGREKCPVCSETVIDPWDLRPVSLGDTTSRPTDLEVNAVVVGSTFSGRLLSLDKGWVIPQLGTCDSSEKELDSVPEWDSPTALYSRIWRGNTRRNLLTTQREISELQAFKERCLRSGQGQPLSPSDGEDEDGDVEYIPSVNLCVELLQQREKQLLEQLQEETQGQGLGQGQAVGRRGNKAKKQPAGDLKAFPAEGEAYHEEAAAESETVKDRRTAGQEGRDRKERSASEGSSGTSSTGLYTYQSLDGSPVYLHPVCVRCIVESAKSSAFLPASVASTVLEVERVRVSAESRQRYPLLRHLPLHCEVWLVEVDLTPLVPAEVQLSPLVLVEQCLIGVFVSGLGPAAVRDPAVSSSGQTDGEGAAVGEGEGAAAGGGADGSPAGPEPSGSKTCAFQLPPS